MKSASIKKILILVTILAVPGFLYYLLQDQGKNRYRPLPIMGPKKIAATFHSKRGKKIPDTIFHQVKDFSLMNQEGKAVNWDSYKGKIVLVYPFYSKGNAFSVNFTNKAVQILNRAYSKNNIVQIIGLTMDPEFDVPQVLLQYGNELSAVPGKWDLLTGDKTQLYGFINNELFVDAIEENDNGKRTFTYGNMIVLLDTQHRIRGYYEATNQEALTKLDDEIKVLIAEELRNSHDGR